MRLVADLALTACIWLMRMWASRGGVAAFARFFNSAADEQRCARRTVRIMTGEAAILRHGSVLKERTAANLMAGVAQRIALTQQRERVTACIRGVALLAEAARDRLVNCRAACQ